MERFAKIKNVGKRRKLNIHAICRCCGLENDEKEAILGQFTDEDVDFQEKVSILTGIHVTANDKMPQSMCSMCMDKINDFFEFRLMAQNTEKQTREALGLPLVTTPPVIAPPLIETKPALVRLVDLKYSSEDTLLIERVMGKGCVKTGNIPSTSKKRPEKAAPAPQPPAKKSKKDLLCSICVDSQFSYQNDLNDHVMKEHLPRIAKYACGSCRETFEQLSDHKAHETRHNREKLPYTCYICTSSFVRPRDYTKHMTNYNCKEKEKLEVTVGDIKCFQCKKKFLTQNLFEWHACFLKSKGSCSKCGQYFTRKKLLFKHYVMCEGHFEAPEAARDPSRHVVKSEASNANDLVKVSNSDPKPTKGPKKKIVPPRKMSTMPSIVKKELQLDASEDPPADDDDYENYEEDITYDNFGNDSDSDGDPSGSALEPVVELQEQHQPNYSAIKIKKERLSDPPAVHQKHPSAQMTLSAQLVRNIKKEKGANPATLVTTIKPLTQQQKDTWKLKIKAERNGKNQSTAQVLNPLALRASQQKPAATTQKNIFKLPQGLAMKIKLEKKDAGYGDNMEERDEAEPEDEDLMEEETNVPMIKIKQEKINPAYGDLSHVPKKKQLINPMALMMRDKSISNGFPEKSLVISAVTSLPLVSASDDGSTKTPNDVETSVDAQGTPEINDVAAQEKPRGNLTMVQIPREFLENQENHSSQSVDVAVQEKEKDKEADSNEKRDEIESMDTDNDLDALLKKYEDAPPADNNDIFQELLKFD